MKTRIIAIAIALAGALVLLYGSGSVAAQCPMHQEGMSMNEPGGGGGCPGMAGEGGCKGDGSCGCKGKSGCKGDGSCGCGGCKGEGECGCKGKGDGGCGCGGHCGGCGCGMHEGMGIFGKLGMIADKLNLTADQKAKVKALRDAFHTKVKLLHEKQATLKKELVDLFKAIPFDKAKVLAKHDEMKKVKTEIMDLRFALVTDIFSSLTDAQKKDVLEKLEKKGDCPCKKKAKDKLKEKGKKAK